MTENKKSDQNIVNQFKINTGSFESIKEQFENELSNKSSEYNLDAISLNELPEEELESYYSEEE